MKKYTVWIFTYDVENRKVGRCIKKFEDFDDALDWLLEQGVDPEDLADPGKVVRFGNVYHGTFAAWDPYHKKPKYYYLEYFLKR
jgi:hypothetical protein